MQDAKLKLSVNTVHKNDDTGSGRVLIKVCPECGSRMVRRTAKKSSKTGSQFWGCSAFPKCKT
ncbi:MAG: topoisomerase DNA-binding C4 zinc finger domain-containing protein, partial [Mariprofundaceae bacterium]